MFALAALGKRAGVGVTAWQRHTSGSLMANGVINAVSRATEFGSGLGDGGAVDGREKCLPQP